MDSWFNRKKAPDGTNIIRHENIETTLGVTKGTAGFTQARETAYERLFGKPLSVAHEVLPLVPHIDVYTFKRFQGEKEVYALITSGMSDLEMTLPREADKEVPRRVDSFSTALSRVTSTVRLCAGSPIFLPIASISITTDAWPCTKS